MGLVQTKQGSAASGSLTITLDAPTTAGNALIVVLASSGTTANPTSVSSVTLGGSAGNFASASTFGSASDAAVGATWLDLNCVGGQTSVAITMTGGSGTIATLATVYEWSGLISVSPFDKTSGGVSAGATSWSSGTTAAVSQPSELLIGGTFVTVSGSTPTITGPSSPWTNFSQIAQVQGSFNDAWMSGYQVVSSGGTATYSGTVSPSSQSISQVNTFKLLVAEPGPLGLLFRQGPSPLDGMLPWTGAPDAPHDVTVNAGTASARALVPATRTFLLLSLVSETGPGATVQTFNDAASLPLLFQPDDPTGGMAPWSGAPDGPSINGNTTANAGVASATGAALQPIVGLGSLPGAAAGTGSAPGPATGLGALPGPAAGTGAALTGSVALVTQGTGTATGTGSVGSPVPSLGSVPGTAAGTGAALDLTAGLGVLPSTAPASGTALPSTGTGTDGPIAPLGLLFLPDDLTGGMQPWGGAEVGIVTGDKSVGAGVATAIGAALGPVASLGILPGTGTAAGAGLQPVAGLGVLPGSATAAGAASGPVTAVAAGPGRAQATAAAFTETSALSALPGTAPANAVAYGATATGSGTTTANAGVATATAAGLQPVAGLGVLPGTAAGTGTGRTATAGLTALPGTAPATGMAQNPSAAFSGTATAGVATGTGAARTASTGLGSVPGTANAAATARQPVPGLSLRAVGTATATAAAYDVTGVVPQVPFQVRLSGRESLSAVSGRESPGLVSGREPAGPSAGREPVSSVSGEEPDSSISGEEAGT